MPTLFPGPLLRTGRGTGLEWFTNQPDWSDPNYVRFFDDFNEITLSTLKWSTVKDAGAAAAIATGTANGELVLTSTATTDNDGASVQGNAVWQALSGRTIWFAARIKVVTAAQQDVFAGLTVAFATNPENVLTASNRIGFQVNDGDASILCKTENADTETSTDSTVDLADATYINLWIMVTGTSQVKFYINGTLRATHTTNIPTAALALALFSLSGEATGTKSMTIDYVGATATR